MKPFLLQAPCKDYLWGGNRLRAFGKESDAQRIAESWELSCHPDGESVIASGEYAGQTLSAFLQAHPEALGENCRCFDRFPVLVKLIDAQDDLSVQVHPDDAYALVHEGEYGKTELWYIIDAEPGAEILYGVKKPMTQAEFRESIEAGTITEQLCHIPVHPGEAYFIPAGTLHAIGKGCLIAEVQQNSNTTYRVYDYGRGRELHIAQALDVAALRPTECRKDTPFHDYTNSRARHLGACRYFSAAIEEISGRCTEFTDPESFAHYLVLQGSGTFRSGTMALQFRKGASLFVPCGTELTIEGNCTLLYTAVG